MPDEGIELHQRIQFWSSNSRQYETGRIVWISPRRTLVAVQVGGQVQFLSPEALRYNPLAAAADVFATLPPADSQERPDRERYLRALSSAYPTYTVRSMTLLEAVRTSSRSGQRWRVFCQAAVLDDGTGGLILDMESGPVWHGGVALTAQELEALTAGAWSPRIGIPNEWDALDIPQGEMARIVQDFQSALAGRRSISYPEPISPVLLSRERRLDKMQGPRPESFPASQSFDDPPL